MNDKDYDILISLNLLDKYVSINGYLKELYTISNNYINNYNIFKIKKKNGKYRTIYEPLPNLKRIQKKILDNYLSKLYISDYAKAYRKNYTLIDNVKDHINKKIILKLDIYKFFDNISFMDIYLNCFSNLPKKVGILLTNLCAYADLLPQGAPTSSSISNIIMKDFDELVGDWCKKRNISYTRYCDDMTFSGDFIPSEIIHFIKAELKKKGFKLNKDKIQIITKGHKQKVTGLVINEKVNTDRKYRQKIRQELYYINKYGLEEHLTKLGISNKYKYLNNLLGRINYVLFINPSKEFIDYKNIIITKKKLIA